MEIIEFKLSPEIRPSRVINPIQYEKTKPKIIKIDSNFHCRVCTLFEGRAVIHDNNSLHEDTVKTNDNVLQLSLLEKINRHY